MMFLFNLVMFRFHVNFQGCILGAIRRFVDLLSRHFTQTKTGSASFCSRLVCIPHKECAYIDVSNPDCGWDD